MPRTQPTTTLFHRFRLRGGDQAAAEFAGRAYAWAVRFYGAAGIEVEPIMCAYPEGWPDHALVLLRAGLANPWIRLADDPPFTADSLVACPDLATLVDQIFVGNWSLGQGFVWHDIAVINQVNGGHEWLVCLRGQPVESFSHGDPAAFLADLEALRGAEG